jgi:hypothetical protein
MMNFANFMQERFGSEVDALFERLRSDYQLCLQECRRAYNECIAHADPNCREELQACIHDCADASGKAIIEELKAIEEKALAAYRAQGGH